MSAIAFHADGNTIKIAASTASTNMALTVNAAKPQVMITNTTTSVACVAFGTVSVTSTMPTTDIPAPGYLIANGTQAVVTPGLATYMSVALLSGTGAVYATAGSAV